ncbi:MAG: prophage regulatory protein [Psychroserpens sp.]|jgi:prophage regulatory protein
MNITTQKTNPKYAPRILRKPGVIALTNLSKSTLYNRVKDGLMPPSISLEARAQGFIASEFYAVLDAMCQEKTPEQIKQLVQELINQRTKVA